MLDRQALRRVDWSDLGHAYGPADDVPGWIESLAGSDADEALSELYGSIAHQGSRYSATVAAIPFLVDVALDPQTPSRAEVVALVQYCTMGYMGRRLDWLHQQELQVAPHERACFDAVVDQHPRLEPLLSERDSLLSGLALVLLSWTGRHSDPVRTHVRHLMESTEETDRLSGFMASTILGAAPPADLANAPAGIDRFGWATAAMRFLDSACPPAAIDELCRSFTDDRIDLTGTPFFLAEDPPMLSAASLASVPSSLQDHTSKALLDSMQSGWARGVDPLAVYLRLHLGEPDSTASARLTHDNVAAIQALLPTIMKWDLRRGKVEQGLWELHDYGLPTSPKALKRWLRGRR